MALESGSKVWVCGQGLHPPLIPPKTGGRRSKECCRNATGIAESFQKDANPEEASPSLISGRDGEGRSIAQTGKTRQIAEEDYKLVPIKNIKTGDFVIAYDGILHCVKNTSMRTHNGEMIGIKHEHCPGILWLTPDNCVLAKRRPRSLGGKMDWSGITKPNFERASKMRKNMTLPEKIMWQMLRRKSLGVKFRRQHPIGSFIPDFYCRDLSLVVEVDGEKFHSSPEAISRDKFRESILRKKLLRIVRFPARRVIKEREKVFEEIKAICDEYYTIEGAEWVPAGKLKIRDVVFFGLSRTGARIEKINTKQCNEPLYSLELDKGNSFIAETCIVHS